MARILVVDDDEDTLAFLRTVLTGAGHQVVLAADGQQCLHFYRQERPDLVVLDIFMPTKDGIEVLLELRQQEPPAKIIAISTGWRVLDLLEQAGMLGADRTLRKPLDPAEVVRVVEELLGPR